MQPQSELCESLPWDSQFFGLAIGRVRPSRLAETDIEEIIAWSKQNQIDCLYYLADSLCPHSCHLAESAGFRLMDVRTTLVWAGVSIAPRTIDVRLALASDEEALVAIARTAHGDSRFFADPRFPRRDCERLYEIWISNILNGSAKVVLVADGERPNGYMTCHIDESGAGSIGLFAVAEQARGKGIGSNLISAALDWFQQRGIQSITVVTQGRNIAAQRRYQRAGFVTQSSGIWLHRWSS